MTKKFVVLFLMLLLPITIWAQNSVMFDFSSSSQNDVVPRVMEKDGITLKLSSKPGMNSSPNYTVLKKNNFLKLDSEGILTLEGEATITSIVIIISDERRRLKVYNDNSKVSCVKASNRSSFYKQEWTGEADRVSFETLGSQGVYINSIKVTFNKDISLAVSSAERATLYYSDRSFIIPEGIVARTYKIEGNILSRSREYKKGDVLPKGTAVVLEAKEGKYIFEETSKTGETDPHNALCGSDSTTITSGGEVYYVFGKGSNGVGFYWKEANGKAFTTEAHKAYLVYTPSKTTNAKSFLGFDVALEIQGPMVREKITFDGPIYNLSGQRVDKDYKGIIIVNGKKYLNR
ncbi:hypothetical protein [Prevotella melaninogenica]|uniref:hypothetical protein n=1 Tax=Prevotella melaninogenica TaxID=28132 RepID=UPI001C5E79F5|nr:hypothetical protein [Prevotella melaninogenica]MBW4733745.1 hypothetical protein [Prevotella melaninogenica]MBW4736162.1 hypothetical protein [Prevotella melaninogenica]MBW4878688.1 hypothetical protein [Prevotella melaninogenica]